MMAPTVKWLLACVLASALALATLPASASAQGSSGTTIELQLPAEIAVGDEATVTARLVDDSGAPVPEANIVLQWTVDFMNAEGDIELGRGATDERGVAVFSFVPRVDDEMQVEARFAGDDQHQASSTSGMLVVKPGPALYHEEAGISVPGIRVSLLVGIVGAVWATYFTVIVLLWLIARQGAAPPPPWRQTHA